MTNQPPPPPNHQALSVVRVKPTVLNSMTFNAARAEQDRQSISSTYLTLSHRATLLSYSSVLFQLKRKPF